MLRTAHAFIYRKQFPLSKIKKIDLHVSPKSTNATLHYSYLKAVDLSKDTPRSYPWKAILPIDHFQRSPTKNQLKR